MSWIDQFLTAIGFVQSGGTPLIQRPTINFVLPPGGSVVDDPTTKVTTVTVPVGAGLNTLAPTGNPVTNVTNINAAFATAPDVYYGAGVFTVTPSATIGGNGYVHHLPQNSGISVSSGSVTVAGNIVAGDYQIFFGSGSVNLPDQKEIRASWFGALCQGGDDAPGINKAIATVATNNGEGGIVRLPTIGQGFYLINSQITIGASGANQNYQAVTLRGDQDLITKSPTVLRCNAELGAGNAMVLMTNCANCKLDKVGLDCNGNADHGFQCRSESLSGSGWGASHRNGFARGGIAGARIYGILNGEFALKPTLTNGSVTFAASGHPLKNGDQVYFRPRIAGVDTIPGGFSIDAYYLVQNVVAGVSFELAPTGGGASIAPASPFSTHLYIQKQDFGDTSQFEVNLVQFRDGGFQDYFQSSVESLGCTLRHCLGQANGFIAPAVQVSSFNGGTNVVTLASGTITDGDLLTFVRDASTDVIPSGLAEDTIYVARDSSGSTCKLAATVGGSVVALGTIGTTGTVWSNKIVAPYYHAGGYGGTLEFEACTAAGYYEDIFISGQPSSAGMGLSAGMFQSQSWRMLHVTNEGRTLFPQAGGFALLNCQHATIVGGGIVSGSRASVIWDLASANTTNLVVLGGSCNRDIWNNGSTAGVSVLNTNLYAYGGGGGNDFQATMRGTLNATSFWSESGVYKTETRNLSTIGPATIGDGTSLVTIDAHTSNLINIKAIDVYSDVTNWHLRTIAAGAIADWTLPSGTDLKLEAFANLTLKGDSSLSLDAGSGAFVASAAGGHAVFSAQNFVTIDASALGTGFANIKTKAGQAIYYDADAHNFRTAAASEFATLTAAPTATDLTVTSIGVMGFVSAGGITFSANGHSVYKVDSGGQIAIFGGSTGPKPTITGVLSAVVDANAKAVLTSIIAALTSIDAATDGTT